MREADRPSSVIERTQEPTMARSMVPSRARPKTGRILESSNDRYPARVFGLMRDFAMNQLAA